MKEMNGEERFISALRCEEVDRMPSCWFAIEKAGLFYKEFKEYKKRHLFKYLKESRRKFVWGLIMGRNWLSRGTSSYLPIMAYFPKFPLFVYYNPETDYFYTKKEAKKLPRRKKNYRISFNGSVLSSGHQLGEKGERLHKYWWYHKPFFSGPDALEKFDAFFTEFGAPWEQEFNPKSKLIKLAKVGRSYMKRKGNPYALNGNVMNHFEAIFGGFGPSMIAKLARKNPEALRDICKKFEKVSILSEQAALEAGFKILNTGDDLGQKGRGLISPKMYEEFFYPALKSRCELAHKHDALIWMHSCGFIEEYLDLMMKAGLDGLQSLEVPAGNDLARIRAKVRDKMCLIGGIDSSRIMTFSTPDEVEAHVKSQMIAATTLDGEPMNGGYIPGPAHDLLDTPLANVERTVHAIAKYGKYPLKWE
ncbi:MAG: uroporphyrinogen decarboxylase family protein [Promethearchaeota archaeon]